MIDIIFIFVAFIAGVMLGGLMRGSSRRDREFRRSFHHHSGREEIKEVIHPSYFLYDYRRVDIKSSVIIQFGSKEAQDIDFNFDFFVTETVCWPKIYAMAVNMLSNQFPGAACKIGGISLTSTEKS